MKTLNESKALSSAIKEDPSFRDKPELREFLDANSDSATLAEIWDKGSDTEEEMKNKKKNKKKKKKKKKGKSTVTQSASETRAGQLDLNKVEKKELPIAVDVDKDTKPKQKLIGLENFYKMIEDISKKGPAKYISACREFFNLLGLLDKDTHDKKIRENHELINAEIIKCAPECAHEFNFDDYVTDMDDSNKNHIRNQAIIALIRIYGSDGIGKKTRSKLGNILKVAIKSLRANKANVECILEACGLAKKPEQKTFIVGSMATKLVEQLINGNRSHVTFSEGQDLDLKIVQKDLTHRPKLPPSTKKRFEKGGEYSATYEHNGISSVTYLHNGISIDATYVNEKSFTHAHDDSLKNFMIDINTGEILGQLTHWALTINKQRRFNTNNSKQKNPKFLAYVIRETARGLKYKIVSTPILEILKNKRDIANSAVSLFLTKYVYKPESKEFEYFIDNLLLFLPFINKLHIEEGIIPKVISILKSIYEKFKSVNKLPPYQQYLLLQALTIKTPYQQYLLQYI